MEMGSHKLFKHIGQVKEEAPEEKKNDKLKMTLTRMFSEESLRSFSSESSAEMMKTSVALPDSLPPNPSDQSNCACAQSLENIELNVKDMLEKFYFINFNA